MHLSNCIYLPSATAVEVTLSCFHVRGKIGIKTFSSNPVFIAKCKVATSQSIKATMAEPPPSPGTAASQRSQRDAELEELRKKQLAKSWKDAHGE